MIEEVTDFISDVGHLNPTQRELEGLVTILVLLMHADERLRTEEAVFFDIIEESCDWRGQMGLAPFIAKKRGEALAALDDPVRLDAFIKRAVEKLESPDLHRPAYLLADQLANSDREVAAGEIDVLERLVQAIREQE